MIIVPLSVGVALNTYLFMIADDEHLELLLHENLTDVVCMLGRI